MEKCSCGLKKVTNIDKADHVADDAPAKTVAATCAADGYKSYSCKNCSATNVSVVTLSKSDVEHTYSTGWVQSGTEEKPTHYHQCSVCGEKETGSEKDCSVSKWTKKTGDDENHYGVCSDCKRSMTAVHEAENPVYGKNGDCTKGVSFTITCVDCGYAKSGTTEKKDDHNYSEDGKCKNPGCAQTKPEEQPTYTCNCGTKDCATATCCKDGGSACAACEKCEACGYEDPCKNGHDMQDEGQPTKAATCCEAGVQPQKCSRCDHTGTREISATGENHSYDADKGCNETCPVKDEELEKGTECTTCGKAHGTKETVIPEPEPEPTE